MVKGLKNAYSTHFFFLVPLSCLLLFAMLIFTQPSGVKGGRKKVFFVKICFNSCIIINRCQMYPSEKNHKTPDRKGGGGVNPYSMTVKSMFFCIADFHYMVQKSCYHQPISWTYTRTLGHCCISSLNVV